MRLQASGAVTFADCARRWAALGPDRLDMTDENGGLLEPSEFVRELTERRFQLRDLKRSVAPCIGTGAHAGFRTLCDRALTDSDPRAMALSEFRREIAGGVRYDKSITPDATTAEGQIGAALRLFQFQILPRLDLNEPVLAEHQMEVDLGDDFVLVGRIDLWEGQPARLNDWKTGARRSPAIAQLGLSVILLEAHEHAVNTARTVHFPRMAPGKPQEPAAIVEYPLAAARSYGGATLRRMKRAVMEFRESGSPEAFPANPLSPHCRKDDCPALGTSFCEAWRR